MEQQRIKFYQIEMDQENYELMKKVMRSYVDTRNKARLKQRTDDTRKQGRAMDDIKFHYKDIKSYEMIHKLTLVIPEVESP
jgi:hypothetical protein